MSMYDQPYTAIAIFMAWLDSFPISVLMAAGLAITPLAGWLVGGLIIRVLRP